MTVTLIGHQPAPIPEPLGAGNVLLLAVTKSTPITFVKSVKAWDPSKHPKGYKGLFIETPNKMKATETKPGDAIVSKSGKTFKVSKQTEKGVKVSPVDQDTGEVKSGYTVLGNDVEVALVETAKSVGSAHPIQDVDPGTYVKNAKGKRFKIKGHGKWTTVWPVDDHGEVDGKHTVLPPGTMVTIDAADVTANPSDPKVKAAIDDAVSEIDALWDAASEIDALWDAVSEIDALWDKPFEITEQWQGEQDQKKQDAINAAKGALTVDEAKEVMHQLYEASGIESLWLEDTGGVKWISATSLADLEHTLPWVTLEDSNVNIKKAFTQALEDKQAVVGTKQTIEEHLPTKLPKVPKGYAPGVGSTTSVEIIPMDSTFVVQRLNQDGSILEGIGHAGSLSAARKLARDASAVHEQISERSLGTWHNKTSTQDLEGMPATGSLVLSRTGQLFRVIDVEDYIDFTGSARYRLHLKDPHGENAQTQKPSWPAPYIVVGEDFLDKGISNIGGVGHAGVGPQSIYARTYVDKAVSARTWIESGQYEPGSSAVLRKARPERYSPYLRYDWSPDELIGATPNEALKVLGSLGYREIKPRAKDKVRVINAVGKRLVLHRDGQAITSVETHGSPLLNIEGSARQQYEQLREALNQGADIASLDPRLGTPEEQTNHVRTLIYDLAVGKKAGVAEKIGKATVDGKNVKSDAAYRAEIEPTLESIKFYLTVVEEPPYVVSSPRDTAMAVFGLEGDFQTNAALTLDEAAALSAILKRRSLATQIAQPVVAEGTASGTPLTVGGTPLTEFYALGLKADNPVDGAKKLAAAVSEWEADKTGPISAWDAADADATVYLLEQISKFKSIAAPYVEARGKEHYKRAELIREGLIEQEIQQRRHEEGTIPEPAAAGVYELPVWDEIEFQEQTFADIQQLTASIGETPHDVPAFYTGGYVKDGVLMHKADITYGKIELQNDQNVTQRLLTAGAAEEPNRNPIDPGYVGSAKLYDGMQITLIESEPVPFEEARDKLADYIVTQSISGTYTGVGPAFLSQKIRGAKDREQVSAVLGLEKSSMEAELLTRLDKYADPGKRIEYVMHDQAAWNAGGAPTNQRGALRVIGYTPEEAAARLKELGLIGDLEPEVPFQSVMRSQRRYGPPAPLLPEYIRGDAKLPKTPAYITHGITNTNAGGAVESLKLILNSGGLMSIHERHRQDILSSTKGVSISGDIRSGIDHAVFCTLDGGGACGSSSQVKFIMKPHAFLRRDIVMAPTDFGGSETRYGQYKSHLNKMQAAAGESKTNLYTPVGPGARQQHLDTISANSDSEWNIGPTIPIEDIEAIQVPPSSQDEVRKLLQEMLADGRISEMPRILDASDGGILASTPISV